MKEDETLFELLEKDSWISSTGTRYTVEDMYQAFKERLIHELFIAEKSQGCVPSVRINLRKEVYSILTDK